MHAFACDRCWRLRCTLGAARAGETRISVVRDRGGRLAQGSRHDAPYRSQHRTARHSSLQAFLRRQQVAAIPRCRLACAFEQGGIPREDALAGGRYRVAG